MGDAARTGTELGREADVGRGHQRTPLRPLLLTPCFVCAPSQASLLAMSSSERLCVDVSVPCPQPYLSRVYCLRIHSEGACAPSSSQQSGPTLSNFALYGARRAARPESGCT